MLRIYNNLLRSFKNHYTPSNLDINLYNKFSKYYNNDKFIYISQLKNSMKKIPYKEQYETRDFKM